MNIVRGFLTFMRGLLHVRLAVQLWIVWLIIINLVAASYFLPKIEALAVMISFVLAAIVMCALTASKGFTRILGLGHLVWLPAIIYLASRLPHVALDTSFGLWLVLLLITNVIALLFDGYDVWRYWQGDRAAMADV